MEGPAPPVNVPTLRPSQPKASTIKDRGAIAGSEKSAEQARANGCSQSNQNPPQRGWAPGPIWTPLQISGGAPEQKYEKFGSTTVVARPGQPAELASIYVQLAADDASFATGNIYGAGCGQGQS